MKIKKAIVLWSVALALGIVSCKNDPKKENAEELNAKETIDYNRKTQSARIKVFSPESELAGFEVPEGFVVELVASERDGIVNPIDLTFDDAGKLWTQTARMYPLDPVSNMGWNDLLKIMDDPKAQEKDPNFQRILNLYKGKNRG